MTCNICAECEHFLGFGDWDLCCKKQVRRLTYEYCEACEEFEHDPAGHLIFDLPKIPHEHIDFARMDYYP